MKRIVAAGAMLAMGTVAASAADFGAAAPYQDPGTPGACVQSSVVGVYGVFGNASGYYEGSGFGMGGYGRGNICGALGDGIHLQLDAFGETAAGAPDADFDGYNTAQFGGVGHFYVRDPNSHALGLMIGLSQLTSSYGDYYPGFLGLIGLDGHWYAGNWTFAGQVFFQQQFGADPSGYDNIDNAVTVQGEARFFVNPNLKLTGIIGGHWENNLDGNSYPSADFFFGAGAEAKFGSSPLSVFGSVIAHQNTITGDNLNTVVVRVGLAGHFGQPTLLAEDRTGPSFNTPMVDTFTHLDNAYYR